MTNQVPALGPVTQVMTTLTDTDLFDEPKGDLASRCCSNWRSILNLAATAVCVLCLVSSLFSGMVFYGFLHSFLLVTSLLSAYYLKDYHHLLDLHAHAQRFRVLRANFSAELAKLRAENTTYQSENQAHAAHNAALQTEVSSLQTTLLELETWRAALKEDELEKLRAIRAATDVLLQTKDQYAQENGRLERTRVEFDALTKQLQTAEQRLSELLAQGSENVAKEGEFLCELRTQLTEVVAQLRQPAPPPRVVVEPAPAAIAAPSSSPLIEAT